MRELVADWEPDRHVEIGRILDALGRDLVDKELRAVGSSILLTPPPR